MMTVCAIYCRKSQDDSDRDTEARSCERQIDSATRYAQEHGWRVGPIFRDDAVSGAEWLHRPGWTALLAALEPRPAFGVLIVSELSRIGRDSVRTPAAVLAVEEAGVEIHSYLNRGRISLADEAGEMSTMLQSLLASFERRRASDRTRDAMRRRFEANAATGGAPFGYTVHRNGGAFAHYLVETTEAATVRQVFGLYDSGVGCWTIARRLNAAGTPTPRGGLWNAASIRQMLGRSVYAGLRTWNQTKRGHRRGTKDQRPRPAAEHLTVEAPELAILDREVFDRVQARIEARGSAFLRSRGGRLIGRPRGTDSDVAAYLLTGLLTCARCGAAMTTIAPGRTRNLRAHYGCAGYHRKGLTACTNGLRLDVTALDEAIVGAVAARLAPDVVAEAVRQAVTLLTATHADTATRRAAIVEELATISAKEHRLLGALEDGDADATAGMIRGRLRDLLARREALAAEGATLDHVVPIDTEALVRDVTGRATDLYGLLRRHAVQARQVLRLMLGGGRFACTPFDDASGRGYRCAAPGDYRRLGIKGLGAFTVGDVGLPM